MTTPSALDPAVEEVLFDLARRDDRTLLSCDPSRIARGLAGANAIVEATATGLLPVERHLLATMREEVLTLLLGAAKESLMESATTHVVAVGPRKPHSSWVGEVEHLFRSNSGVLPLPEAELRTLASVDGFRAELVGLAVAAARQLDDSPRTRLYAAWEQLSRDASVDALRTTRELLREPLPTPIRRASLEVAYIAFGALGEDRLALRACLKTLTTSHQLDEPAAVRAVLAANVLLFALRSQDVAQAERAVRELEALDDPQSRAALRSVAQIARRSVRDSGSGTHFDRTLAHRLGANCNDAIREVCLALG